MSDIIMLSLAIIKFLSIVSIFVASNLISFIENTGVIKKIEYKFR